jgi:hypothetical protein
MVVKDFVMTHLRPWTQGLADIRPPRGARDPPPPVAELALPQQVASVI